MRLLQAGVVLSGAIAVAAPLEATMGVAASGALTEEVKEEVMGEAMEEVAVSLEVPTGAEALEALAEEVMGEAMEEAMEEATGRPKE